MGIARMPTRREGANSQESLIRFGKAGTRCGSSSPTPSPLPESETEEESEEEVEAEEIN